MLKQAILIAIVLIIITGSTGIVKANNHSKYRLPSEVQPYANQYNIAGKYFSSKTQLIYVLTHKTTVGQMAWAVFSFDADDHTKNPTNLDLIEFIVLNREELYLELIWRKKRDDIY